MTTLKRALELPGRILLTWFSTGALLTGGVLVTIGLYHESITHYYLLYTVAGLYIVGGLAGILSGGALGMFGRPLDMKLAAAFQDQLKGLLYIIMASGPLFVVAGWIGLTYWAIKTVNLMAIGFVTVSWLIGAVIFTFALEYGWFGLKNLSARLKKAASFRIRISFDG